MAKKVCRIVRPEHVQGGTLRVRKTKRGDALLSGKLVDQEAETLVAIKFADGVNEEDATAMCNSFSGEMFDAVAASFGYEWDDEAEEISQEVFDAEVQGRQEAEVMHGSLLLSVEKKGKKIEVVIARAGKALKFTETGNPVTFTPEVLRDAAPKFEGVKVRVYRNSAWFDHLENLNPALAASMPEGIEEAEVGTLSAVKFDQKRGALVATLTLDSKAPATALLKMLERAQKLLGSIKTFMGLSMVIDMWRNGEGIVTGIEKCLGVDVVSIPAAGGHFERVVASFTEAREEALMREHLVKTLLAMGFANADLDGKDETALFAMIEDKRLKDMNALTAQVQSLTERLSTTPTGADTNALSTKLDEIKASMTTLSADITATKAEAKKYRDLEAAKARINASTLPDPSKERVVASLSVLPEVTDDLVTSALSSETAYVEKITKAVGFSDLGDIRVGFDSLEKIQEAFAVGLQVEGAKKDWGSIGLKEFYQNITGDYAMTRQHNKRRVHFDAGTTADFPLLLANVLNKRLLPAYRLAPFNEQVLISDTRTASDFKSMRAGIVGGFGTLDDVLEGGTYQPKSMPTEYKLDYSVSKRGNLMEITWEMIVNDDIGLVRRHVENFGKSARTTHSKYVYGLLTANGNSYDGISVFNATAHTNLGSSALASAELTAIKSAMFAQTELNSGEALGLRPFYLFVPEELENTAKIINTREYEDDAFTPNVYRYMFGNDSERIITVPHWTDTNNYYIAGDPRLCPLIEMAYFNGETEPVLLLQDNVTVGSVFTAEKYTYKIRHIYAGAILSHQNLYAEIVT